MIFYDLKIIKPLERVRTETYAERNKYDATMLSSNVVASLTWA